MRAKVAHRAVERSESYVQAALLACKNCTQCIAISNSMFHPIILTRHAPIFFQKSPLISFEPIREDAPNSLLEVPNSPLKNFEKPRTVQCDAPLARLNLKLLNA